MLLRYFLLGLCVKLICTSNNTSENIPDEYIEEDSFYPPFEWSDTFDWKVLTILSQQSENVLFSPTSLKLVLGILYEASSGKTQKEFENALQYLSKESVRNKTKDTIESLHVSPESRNILKFNTKLYLDSRLKIKELFAKRIKEYYETNVECTNFTEAEMSANKINSWASESTLGALKQLVVPDDIKDMTALLVNAIYFKGFWRHTFPKNETHIAGFFSDPESKMAVYIPYMTTSSSFYYFKSQRLEARILRMPYKGNQFSMFFILPFSKGGLPNLIKNINLLTLHRELYYLAKTPVLVTIPKFSFKLKASYKDILKQFEFREIFENTASFPGIAEGNSSVLTDELIVSDILQSASVDVDEEGSETFAATDVIIGNKIGVPENVFNASHPFLFFIQDDTTGTILFLGKLSKPTNQQLEIKKTPDIPEDIKKEFQQTSSPPTKDPIAIR
ncbi:unnamed protein product [Ceutorhynchus assimilis]|uniref:Serpin domain-containing protein n=1 Tax=Ceutorhynchus assimilis TaxID=467358 RepID=A0A9N9MCG6_9CUCU|nr:unnamed protein product [Ceutorhynchus assimilis]